LDKGRLYLIPCPIAEDQLSWVSKEIINVTSNTKYYIAEKAKTCRYWLKKMNPNILQQEIVVEELNKHDVILGLKEKMNPIFSGIDIGIMSEAGNPCIGDPGHQLVAYAHENDIEVIPLIGPCSFILAMISSGFNGQKFTFHGYLPNKKDELIRKIKSLELQLQQTGYTQIFMEVPYRNIGLLESLLSTLSPQCLLSISSNIGSPDQILKTKKIIDWRKSNIEYLHKVPCVYLIGY
jgi:16S rRNA (cytidine1402-2'-O)-methyltransferase